ncbi:MAG: hypothetical protein AB8B93_05420 [Pseudomonadales bacterium]
MPTHLRIASRTLQSLLLATSLLFGWAATAQAEPSENGAAWADAFWNAEKISLTDGHVERFIAAVTELKAQNFDYQMRDNADAANWSEAFNNNERMSSIIQRHGFADGKVFESTVYSIVAGIASIEMEQNRPEIEKAKAQLAQMKGQMPAETYAMLEQQMLGVTKMFNDQPAGNVDVVRKYREQLKVLDSED